MPTSRATARTAVLALTVALLVAACEPLTVMRVNDVRTAAGRPTLPTSVVASDAARAHSQAMCAAGSATPSADPAEAYDQETSAGVVELVGSAVLDQSIPGGVDRDDAAGREIFDGWAGDPTLVDARWDSIGVGEVHCPDGRLYATAVLRDAPSMPASGRFSSPQYDVSLVQTVSAVQYGTAVNHAGQTVSLLLDLYVPPSTGSPRPLVLLFHGGGFVGGNRTDMAAIGREYARRGYVAASIGYRLDPRVAQGGLLVAATNAIDDGMESVRWLKANAATYGIDVTRIGALGVSAGGAITLGLSVADDPTPGGPLAAFSPTIDAAVSTGAHLTPGIGSPLLSFEADDPAVLMFHYELDDVTAVTDDYAFETCAEVRAAGSTCDFVTQPGSGHTTSVNAGGSNWTSRIGPFLWHHLDL